MYHYLGLDNLLMEMWVQLEGHKIVVINHIIMQPKEYVF